MHSITKNHKISTIIVCVIGFLIPFFFKEEQDTFNSILSISFTILGTIGTLLTLYIAFLLYDRFGINAKFKDKQVDIVINLATLLTETNIIASTHSITYHVQRNYLFLSGIYSINSYKTDSKKTILFPANLFELIKDIDIIRNSYWLPKEIKEKMNFLNLYGLSDIFNPSDDDYIRLDINKSGNGNWMESFPRITFEMFILNLLNLLKEIDNWLKKHSNIPVELRFQ